MLATAVALLLLAAACGGGPATNPTATVTAEVTSGKEPNASVRGTVTYRERIPLTPGAWLEVDLRDTSLQDVASVLIARQTIEDPGQVPIAFEVEYNRDDIDDRNTYSVEVRIIEADGRLAFTNDTAYDVITRGNPDRVDIPLVLVQPPPDLAAQVDGDHRTWVERPPQVIRAYHFQEFGDSYVRIEFYQSTVENCSRPGSQGLEVRGREIAATLTLQQPPDVPWDTGCAAEFVELDTIEYISGGLAPGEPYTITVNGEAVSTFTLPDERLGNTVIAESPVQRVEVMEMESNPVQFALQVVSGRPSGSCTQHNGYEIVRRNDNTINVRITHHQVADRDAMCTADFPIEETVVLLGTFEAGVEYTVTVNGEPLSEYGGPAKVVVGK
ncbi:MAG: YbaY family lipoprotein [Chloroflexi bacterium]|nr:YbaY family lipoprotein [Chloroflexota bacterium]